MLFQLLHDGSYGKKSLPKGTRHYTLYVHTIDGEKALKGVRLPITKHTPDRYVVENFPDSSRSKYPSEAPVQFHGRAFSTIDMEALKERAVRVV